MDTNYEMTDGRPTLRLERRLAHPVGAVWTAITDPQELTQWFPSTIEGELRDGSRLSFSFPEYDEVPDMEGRVTAFDPPRELGFDWGTDHIRFELAPAGEHTDLRLTVRLDSADKAARDGAGWHVCLALLEASLDGAGKESLKAISDDWRSHYDEYARRGFPATAPIPGAAADTAV
jgi:uncharacterized protein YndB with AHSA1/START domain